MTQIRARSFGLFRIGLSGAALEEYVGRVEVRSARRRDLVEIGRLAHEVWWEAYTDLVATDTINRALDANYSPAVLAERILKHHCFLAEQDGRTVGFAEGVAAKDRIVLETLYCRQSGDLEVGRQLIDRLHSLAPGLPMCSDVVLGHLQAEQFFEAVGFAPGEVIEEKLEGEAVVQRRWWLEPAAQSVAFSSHDRRLP